MELRHLRYFIAVAEELHFARAAERLHIEQSPLSRAIRDLEGHLNVRLFERTTRNTRMTPAGRVLLEESRQLLASIEKIKFSVRAVARGYRGNLQVGACDSLLLKRLSHLIRFSAEEDPAFEVRLVELSQFQQIQALKEGTIDVGFSFVKNDDDRIDANAIWTDSLVVVLPIGHPLAVQNSIDLEMIINQPLILLLPDKDAGFRQNIDEIIKKYADKPNIAHQVKSFSMMITLVSAARGVGFALAAQMQVINSSDVVVRRIAGQAPVLTTYLLNRKGNASQLVSRFCERARAIL